MKRSAIREQTEPQAPAPDFAPVHPGHACWREDVDNVVDAAAAGAAEEAVERLAVVVTGLDPVIHLLRKSLLRRLMDARIKSRAVRFRFSIDRGSSDVDLG